jgi:predicted enzyme related to lactoylglutathione lyase
VSQNQLRTTFAHPTPELPVEDVERAQQHYRDALGFEIGWLYPGGDIGAVSRDHVAIFFRRRERPFEPAVHWVFAAEIDATYEELRSRGARIVEPLERSPGACASSRWKISMETASIFTATDAAAAVRSDISTGPLY